MKLSVSERITLLNILPREGDFSTLKIIRNLQNGLSFSEEEHAELQFKNAGEKFIITNREGNPIDKDGNLINDDEKEKIVTGIVPEGQVRWNNKGIEKDVQIGEKATDVIVDVLKKLNEQKRLNDSTADLYEKFVVKEK